MIDLENSGPVGAALETVIIFTRRMETLASFYQTAFGLGEFLRSPGHIGMRIGPVYLGFDQVEAGASGNAISLWFTVDDIDQSFEKLVDMGAEIRYAPAHTPWGGLLAAVYDPDGNMIGLSQRAQP